MVYICIECSWKYNSSEENRDNQLFYENLNNAKVTTIDVHHIYEHLRTTSFNSCLESKLGEHESNQLHSYSEVL